MDLAQLTDQQAVALLRILARRWVEQPNVEAFVSYQRLQANVLDLKLVVPDWLEEPPEAASPELVRTSRAALEAIATGDDETAKAWLNAELDHLQHARAQMVDPITLSILGATLIGCILAARVKQIGSIAFYEGVPPELAKIIKIAGSTITK